MIKQFLKIILRNKTKNLLLFTQFSLSFIALYMLATKTISIYNSFSTPLGFEPKNLVGAQISGLYSVQTEEEFDAVYPYLKQAMDEVRELPYVKHAGYLNIHPYGSSNNNSNGNKIDYLTPGALEALGLEHLSGEVFKREHQFETEPMVSLLNEEAMEFYKERNQTNRLLGKNLYKVWQSPTDTSAVDDVSRIIGSFRDFRIHGRFRSYDNKRVVLFLTPFENRSFFASKFSGETNQNQWILIGRQSSVLARTDGSVSITVAMKAISQIYKKYLPNNTTSVSSIEQLHNDSSKGPVKTFLILFFICIVLTFVIVIGVIAITKENITKRFKEIGIRMALGSSANQVKLTFLTELFIIAVASSVLSGISIYLLNEYHVATFTIGFGEYLLSFSLLLAVVLGCVYSPIKKASAMKPNLALHYE